MSNRSLLYIGEAVMHTSKGGYDIINLRNIKLLKNIYKDNTYIYEINHKAPSAFNKFRNIFNLLCGNDRGIKESDYEKILSIIKEKNIKDVFISTSLYGKLVQRIKINNPEIRIISFFHNIEVHYNAEELKFSKGVNWIKRIITSKIRNTNELYTVQKSDIIITLNNRDSLMLYKIYNRKSDLILPSSFDDLYDSSKAKKYVPLRNNKINLLFIGVNFFANTNGVKWFIDNVLYNIPNAHLTIAGRDMDKAFIESKQVSVFGYVDDLSNLYYSADIVILPIFNGAGMKTKTAEALMYGCPVVGTSEAFEGYDFDITKVGCVVNTASDMISSILELTSNKGEKLISHRKNSRIIFNSLYNSNIQIEILRKLLMM